jgi:hypothetical protein
MRVKDARAARHEPTQRGFRTICRFNFEPADGVLIYDCTLVRAPNGRVLVYGPSSKTDGQLISLAPDVRRDLITMTLREAGIDDDEDAKA